jgi:omega-6 fatty acid desaturase (delta-12 desaturase)
VSLIDRIKQHKRTIINKYSKACNVKGFTQVLTTLVPIAVLWWAAMRSIEISYWLTAAITLAMSLFLLRVFVLMHECGHESLFRTGRLNKTFGFIFGVLSGMPQYVWSKHHAYHHSTNGDWEKYRGPLTTKSVEEFATITARQQRMYEITRNVWLAPFGGFLYLIFNPRFTWLKGSIEFIGHIVKSKIAEPRVSVKKHAAEFKTSHWKDAKEYWHMFWNNTVLIGAWGIASFCIELAVFFPVYLLSLSIAGGAGIILFTVQHNFEHSYATKGEHWDYDTAAIHGTSFLVLPTWLNWFTANIAYHHIHHLSAKIPNYRLAQCHEEYQDLFANVRRVKLSAIGDALKHILWDADSHRIISIAEYRRR